MRIASLHRNPSERSAARSTLATALLVFGLLLLASPSFARDVFSNTVTTDQGGSTITRFGETSDITEVFGLFGVDTLQDLLGPGYTDTDPVDSRIDLRGVDLNLSFAANSDALLIEVPQIGESILWDDPAISRDGKIKLIQAWLEGEFEIPTTGDGSIAPILQAFLEYSPVDPIAGNPNSLQSKMVNSDYVLAGSAPFVKRDKETGRFVKADNWLRTEGDFSYFNANGIRGESYDIAVSYGLNLPTRRLALIFDLPIALTRSGSGGLSYMGSGAVGLQVRMTPNWNITPIMRVGLGGSFDLGAVAVLYSGSVISTAQWKIKGYDVAMANLVGVESNIDRVKYNDTPVEYGMTVGIFQNGFTVGKPIRTRLFNKRMRWNAYYRLTNFVGTDLFLNNQHAAGLRYSTGGHADGLTLEIGWAGGKDYDSLRMRFVARF
jgi:hypothetical protein